MKQVAGNLLNGLVGAWCPSLGATGTRLLDRSPYANHGTLTNMDPPTDWVTSGGKGALDFDGSNDYVTISNPGSLKVIEGLTISCWIKISNNAAVSPIVSKSQNGTSGEFEIFADFRSGGTALAWRPGSATNLAGFFSGYTGTWFLMTVTCNGSASGSTTNAYRNGVFFGTVATNAARTATTNNVTIGTRDTSSFFASTLIDDLRVYNRVLTDSEINQLPVGGRGYGLTSYRTRRFNTLASATNRRRRLICGANC